MLYFGSGSPWSAPRALVCSKGRYTLLPGVRENALDRRHAAVEGETAGGGSILGKGVGRGARAVVGSKRAAFFIDSVLSPALLPSPSLTGRRSARRVALYCLKHVWRHVLAVSEARERAARLSFFWRQRLGGWKLNSHLHFFCRCTTRPSRRLALAEHPSAKRHPRLVISSTPPRLATVRVPCPSPQARRHDRNPRRFSVLSAFLNSRFVCVC